jgi:hypothetical protein
MLKTATVLSGLFPNTADNGVVLTIKTNTWHYWIWKMSFIIEEQVLELDTTRPGRTSLCRYCWRIFATIASLPVVIPLVLLATILLMVLCVTMSSLMLGPTALIIAWHWINGRRIRTGEWDLLPSRSDFQTYDPFVVDGRSFYPIDVLKYVTPSAIVSALIITIAWNVPVIDGIVHAWTLMNNYHIYAIIFCLPIVLVICHLLFSSLADTRSLIYARYRAWREKVCPVVEFVDQDDAEPSSAK